jgi:hypothetical protein
MPYDLYSTDELLPMVESLFVPGNFLLKAFFPNVIEFETQEVHFDRVLPDRRLAPFVSPLAPGKIQQPRAFQTETLVPAYLKPKNQVTANQAMSRMAGEPLTGSMSPQERRDRQMLAYTLDHRTKIERRLEWMASSILRTGAVTIVGDDYPSTLVNFARTGSLTKTLITTARWGENGVEPFDNVETWIGEVATASGAAVNIVVMDALAWGLYIAGDPAITTKDSKALRSLDRTKGQTAALNLGLTPALPGSPVYKGMIGDVEFYVYNDKYEADTTGTVTSLIPDYTVIIGSQGGVEGAQLFGSIIDPRNNYAAARYFTKNWIDEDPAGEFVMTQSAPILAPKRVDATLAATVR